jgi:Chaperone of endosialidase
LKIRGTTYHFKTKEFKENNFPENQQMGLIAQEIEKVYPELVVENNDGLKSITKALYLY